MFSILLVCFNLLDVIDSIMTFLVALCDSLKVQVGPQFIERTIQTIMGLFTRYVPAVQLPVITNIINILLLLYVSVNRCVRLLYRRVKLAAE